MPVKPLRISVHGNDLHIEDYPDAVAVKALDAQEARQLGSLVLNERDLRMAEEALHAGDAAESLTPLSEVLWTSAVALYFKAFGASKARIPLDAKKIFKGRPDALQCHRHFADLRNKHLLHDENAYAQPFVGLALNRRGMDWKVADVLSGVLFAYTADDSHRQPFRQLVGYALAWVSAERDGMHERLGKQYNAKSYDELDALSGISFRVPGRAEVGKTRPVGIGSPSQQTSSC
jgi:hypothetical protein